MTNQLTITHDGARYVGSQDELREGGVPQEVIDAALRQQRAAAVKAECRRRIYAAMSAETQMNMTAASTAITAKPASSRTTEEKALLAALQAALDWVQAMRARAAELIADASADYLSDAAWPPLPDEVAQVVAQF